MSSIVFIIDDGFNSHDDDNDDFHWKFSRSVYEGIYARWISRKYIKCRWTCSNLRRRGRSAWSVDNEPTRRDARSGFLEPTPLERLLRR